MTSQPKSQHTPGPWAVSGDQITVPAVSHAGKSARVALVYHSSQTHPDVRRQAGANAALIAAAPEMLAVLKRLVQWSESGVPYSSTVTDEAEAAIAKAEQGDA